MSENESNDDDLEVGIHITDYSPEWQQKLVDIFDSMTSSEWLTNDSVYTYLKLSRSLKFLNDILNYSNERKKEILELNGIDGEPETTFKNFVEETTSR